MASFWARLFGRSDEAERPGPAGPFGPFGFFGPVDYLKQAHNNHVFRGVTLPTLPASLYLSLHTADPGGSGANETTVITRLAVTRSLTNWAAPAARATENSVALTFANPTGSATLTYVGCWDASTAGNFLFQSALTTAKTVNNGDPGPQFAIGAFDAAMTGAYSDYLATAILNWLFRGQAFATLGTDLFISLHTSNPGTTGAGEVSGGGYARVAVARQTTSWSAAGANGQVSNSGQITFPTPTANWGVVGYVGIWDAATAGNFLFGGALSAPRTINANDAAPFFAASALSVTLA